jgi:hypothetical protein
MMGGRCDGGGFVYRLFEDQVWGTCRDCIMREYSEEDGGIRCQVLEGREELMGCPELAEYVRYEEIKLYGANKPPERKTSLRFQR